MFFPGHPVEGWCPPACPPSPCPPCQVWPLGVVGPPHDIPFWKWETKCRLGVEENLGVTSQNNYLIFFFYSVNLKFSISHGGGFFASKSILSENRPPLKLFKEHKSLVPGRNSKICFLFPGSTTCSHPFTSSQVLVHCGNQFEEETERRGNQ